VIALIFLAALFFAPIVICLFAGHWQERIRIAAVIGFMVLVPALFLLFDHYYYAPSRTTPVTMPPKLARVGSIRTPVFRRVFDDIFHVNLITDHIGPGIFCLKGEYPDILKVAQCDRRDPELNVAWIAREGTHGVGSGDNAVARWHRIATAPTALERDVLKGGYPQLLTDAIPRLPGSRADPSMTQLGWFQSERGHDYQLMLMLAMSVPTLAKLHPRLEVRLNPMLGKFAGPLFLAVIVICFFGGIAILFAGSFGGYEEPA
jgi:hypothetical protein